MCVYLAATAQWYLLPTSSGEPLTFPSYADAGYLSAYALFAVALVRATSKSSRWFGLDALLVSAALAGPIAELVLRPTLATSMGGLGQAVAVAYPVALLTLLALMCRLALGEAHDDTGRRWLLVSWMAMELIADCVYSVTATAGTFSFGSSWFCVWLIGYTFLGVASLRPHPRQVPRSRQAHLRVRLFCLPVAAAVPLVTAGIVADRGSVPYLALAAAATVTGLSMWRIASLSGDVEGLRRAQHELDRLAGELRDSADRMRFLAMHDSLTGLGNRAFFYERLNHHLAQRTGASAVLLMDLDDFKIINDTHGHHAGDALLTTVASRLRSVSREGDTVARLGGDEFVVVIVDVDVAQARIAADRYLEAVNHDATVGNDKVPVLASAGLAMAYPGMDSTCVVREADAAMYAAKRRTPTSRTSTPTYP
jgi:diguanylate cyclase (GGDEF)-like protein